MNRELKEMLKMFLTMLAEHVFANLKPVLFFVDGMAKNIFIKTSGTMQNYNDFMVF